MRALSREDGDAAAKALAEHLLMAKEQTLRDFEQLKVEEADQGTARGASRERKRG
jgi:DNA-binding GntR family transcriptional regulator